MDQLKFTVKIFKIFMHLTNKRRNKPLYKKFLTLRKNIQNNDKFLRFRKKK